jgi:hypothetical protein
LLISEQEKQEDELAPEEPVEQNADLLPNREAMSVIRDPYQTPPWNLDPLPAEPTGFDDLPGEEGEGAPG